MTNYEKYRESKDAFFKRHKHTFECEMAPTWRTASATVTIEGVAIKIERDVKLFECEYFSSDYSKSGKYYEKW